MWQTRVSLWLRCLFLLSGCFHLYQLELINTDICISLFYTCSCYSYGSGTLIQSSLMHNNCNTIRNKIIIMAITTNNDDNNGNEVSLFWGLFLLRQIWSYTVNTFTGYWKVRPPHSVKIDRIELKGKSLRRVCANKSWRVLLYSKLKNDKGEGSVIKFYNWVIKWPLNWIASIC